MTEPRSVYTFPKEQLGSKQAKYSDHGPFYLFSLAFSITRIGQRDSVPILSAFRAVPCTDQLNWVPMDQLLIQPFQKESRVLHGASKEEWGAVVVPADKTKESILDMYGDWGVIELTSFRHKFPNSKQAEEYAGESIDLDIFNAFLEEGAFDPWTDLSPDKSKDLLKRGALALRYDVLLLAEKFLAESELPQKALYLSAISEIKAAFNKAKIFLNRELTESDSQIKLALAGQDGKPHYDQRDYHMQWLTARRPIEETLFEREPQQIVVNVPENSASLSKEDIASLIKVATESAVRAALAVKAEEETSSGISS